MKQAPVPNLSQQPELDSIADYQNVQNLKPQFPDIITPNMKHCQHTQDTTLNGRIPLTWLNTTLDTFKV